MIDLNTLREQEAKIYQEKVRFVEQSAGSMDPETILKAQSVFSELIQQTNASSNQKTLLFDPYMGTTSFGFKSKRGVLSYETLRRMGGTPIIDAIISTRVDQLAAFTEPQRTKYDTGFIIRKKNRGGDESQQPSVSREDQKIINKLTDFILNCGTNTGVWNNDDFDSFTRKFCRDLLTIDQGVFEIVRSNKGSICEYLAVDGATFRIADTHSTYGGSIDRTLAQKIKGYYPSHVQVYQEQVIAEFYPWECCFASRNTRTSIYSNGYGYSELEILINVITWMLYSDQYNSRNFTHGSFPKGFLKAKGAITNTRLMEWRQQWMSQSVGVDKAHRIPVLGGQGIEEIDWVPISSSNRDMEFGSWQSYLVKLACAVYKISPEEIGFKVEGGPDGQKSLFESNKEGLLKYSKDKGLRPLLKFFQKRINKWLINPEYPDFEFVLVGLDQDEAQELDLDAKRKGFMGLKELRRKNGLPDQIDEDDVILDPTYLQWLGIKQQNQQSDQQDQEYQQDQEEDPNEANQDTSEPYYTRGGDLLNSNDNPLMKAFLAEFEKGFYNE